MSRAAGFAPLSDEAVARWSKFGHWDREYFPDLVGLTIEEARTDYCRMRLTFRDVLEQPAGIVHGGAIATLLDTVVVPAVGSAYAADVRYSTVDMHVQFMSALIRDDAVAEGWIVRRGRSVVFCEAEARAAATGKL
ncbi:MAG: PaaI family thioesterase, partial [Ilumatobacteraceae bacterium]